jgi:hypothetical protein
MSGPKRNPDRLNTIGVIVVGICGAVLVYVSIVALQAFYMNDTSEIQMMADYGGNDVSARTIRTSQIQNINEFGANAAAPGKTPTYRTPIELAMKYVVDAAKVDPAALVPAAGRSDKATVQPVYGRPTPTTPAAPASPADGTGSGSAAGAGSAAPAGAGSAAPAGAGAGSAAPAGGMVVPRPPTGGMGPGGSAPSANPPQGSITSPASSPVGNRPPSAAGTGGATGSAAKGNGP